MKEWSSILLLFSSLLAFSQQTKQGALNVAVQFPVSVASDEVRFPFTTGVGGALGYSYCFWNNFFVEGSGEYALLNASTEMAKSYSHLSANIGVGMLRLPPSEKALLQLGGLRTLATFVPDDTKVAIGEEVPPNSLWIDHAVYIKYGYNFYKRFYAELSYVKSIPHNWDEQNYYSYISLAIKFRFTRRSDE